MKYTAKQARENICKILKTYDATNKASWWQISDVIVEEIKKTNEDCICDKVPLYCDHCDKEIKSLKE